MNFLGACVADLRLNFAARSGKSGFCLKNLKIGCDFSFKWPRRVLMAWFCSHHGWVKGIWEPDPICPGSRHKSLSCARTPLQALLYGAVKKVKQVEQKLLCQLVATMGTTDGCKNFFSTIFVVALRLGSMRARARARLCTAFSGPAGWNHWFFSCYMGYLLEMMPRNPLKPLLKL